MHQTPDQSSDYPSSEPTKSQQDSWWKEGVIYQIYPRSFQDGNGDGVGDIPGIEGRLDYLQTLGVSAVWVSPFFKSPMKDFGYDVEDHRAIDPLFGTLSDFDRLIEAAHQRGIRVLIDLVLSHTADSHPWFEEARTSRDSQYGECYVWADPKENGDPPNNWLSVFGGSSWTYEPRRKQYFLHNFLESQPDLNFHCPLVQKEALSVARWWLERGVDGFRLDTVNFYFHDRQLRDNPLAPHPDEQVVTADNPYSLQDHVYDKNRPQVCDFLSDLGTLLAEFPGSIALGEVGATQERALSLMQQYQQPGRLHLSYTFDLLSPNFSASHFRRILARDATEGGGVWRCLAFSNHDIRRTATRLNLKQAPTDSIASAAMALLLTLRGTPCIYQGEELGLTEVDIPYEQLVDPYGIAFWPKFKGRDGCRTPIPWQHDDPHAGFTLPNQNPWLPVAKEHTNKAVDLQSKTPDSLFHKTRALIELHRNNKAFHSQRIAVLDSPEEILVFERGEGDSRVLCTFNLSEKPINFALPNEWASASMIQQSGSIDADSVTGKRTYDAWSWQLLQSL
ncbi:MAG: alpha-glucosidase [Deltaproteobacteria bacterium]|nr:alpha-glucosidase [Deltaproteobacteria bacterium]